VSRLLAAMDPRAGHRTRRGFLASWLARRLTRPDSKKWMLAAQPLVMMRDLAKCRNKRRVCALACLCVT